MGTGPDPNHWQGGGSDRALHSPSWAICPGVVGGRQQIFANPVHVSGALSSSLLTLTIEQILLVAREPNLNKHGAIREAQVSP